MDILWVSKSRAERRGGWINRGLETRLCCAQGRPPSQSSAMDEPARCWRHHHGQRVGPCLAGSHLLPAAHPSPRLRRVSTHRPRQCPSNILQNVANYQYSGRKIVPAKCFTSKKSYLVEKWGQQWGEKVVNCWDTKAKSIVDSNNDLWKLLATLL